MQGRGRASAGGCHQQPRRGADAVFRLRHSGDLQRAVCLFGGTAPPLCPAVSRKLSRGLCVRSAAGRSRAANRTSAGRDGLGIGYFFLSCLLIRFGLALSNRRLDGLFIGAAPAAFTMGKAVGWAACSTGVSGSSCSCHSGRSAKAPPAASPDNNAAQTAESPLFEKKQHRHARRCCFSVSLCATSAQNARGCPHSGSRAARRAPPQGSRER